MPRNNEGAIFRRGEGRLTEPQEALYEIIVPENRARAIDIKEFADLYGGPTVKQDTEYVERLEEKFKEGDAPEANRKLSELFEALVNSQIEESDWMGGDASVIVPSRYDDIANGIDSIVEFDDEKTVSHLALAIDVTESEQGIVSKFERIRDSIERDQLSRAKYFKSKNFRGELRHVPRVVVGAEGSTIQEITDLLLRFKRMQAALLEARKSDNQSESFVSLRKQFSQIRNELANHPMQRIILLEIQAQLQAFRDYADTQHKTEAAKDYGRMLEIVNGVIAEKDEAEIAMDVPEDRVLAKILERSRSFQA